MSRAAERVRCYNCGRLGPLDAPGCASCGATFGALCGCGAEHSVFDDECPRCGAAHVPKRVPTAKLPYVRAAKWTALCLAIAATGWIVWARFVERHDEPWRLKLEAKSAFAAADYDTAAALCREVTETAAPSDPEGWYLLAATYRAKKFPPEVYKSAAETALKCQDDYWAARQLLAEAELELGHIDRAIVHAQKAAKSPNANADAWMLLARIELMKPRPDLAGAQAALERARAGGPRQDTVEVKALLAEVTIRLHGAIAGGADRLPPRAASTLRTALAALDAAPPRAGEGATVSMTKARILLALGEAEKAFIEAERALSQLPADAPPAAGAAVRLVRAMALHARGNKVDAMAALAEVLRDAPDAATASAASSFLVAADDGAAARGLLARAADTNDPKGAVHAVLATLLLAQGAPDEAARAIETARHASPQDAFFAEILGSVRVAQGRFAEGRAAYDDAIRLSPDLVEAYVRRALVILAEPSAGGAADAANPGCAQALRDLQALRARFGDDPLLLQGIGRMNLAVGDVAAARAALETAAVMSPADADVWIALAQARRRSGTAADGDALAGAAAAWGRARLVRPDDAAIALAEADAWIDAGKYEVAVSACTEFLRRHPDADAVLRARAGSYLRLSMSGLAAADLRRLSEIGRATPADLGALVDALYRSGDARAAKQSADEAKGKVSPNLLEFLAALHGGDTDGAIAHLAADGPTLTLAEIQLAAGRAEDSIATLRSIGEVRPGDPWVARLLVAELLGPDPPPPGRLEESRALLASIAPGSPPGVARLVEGRILLAERRNAEAVAPLREAARDLPDDPFASLFLGEALFRGGDRTESLAAIRRAASLPGALPSVRAIAADRLLQASGESRDLDFAESLAREAARFDPRSVGAALRTVDLLHARGDFAQAADVAERALHVQGISPTDAVGLRVASAFEHLMAGEFQAAEVHVDALPPEVRDSDAGVILMAFAELGAGRADKARALLGSLLARDPANAIATVGMIRVDLVRGDRAAATARADAWRAAHPADRDVTLAASRLMLAEGHADEAMRLAAACVSQHPGDIVAAVSRATVLRRAGRPAEAVDSLRKFAASAPADDAARTRVAVAALSVQCATAVPEALSAAQEIAADPAAPDHVRSEAAVVTAEALAALGRFPEAAAAARSVLGALDASPQSGPAERLLKSRAHFVVGLAEASATPPRRTQAVEEFVRCTDLDRENLDVANNLAWIMAHDGDAAAAAQALALARRITRQAPGDANYWDTHAEVAKLAGEPDEAASCWARSLELSAAAKKRDPARELRVAMRFARFLRARDPKDDAAARHVLEGIRPLVAGTPAEREIDRFLTAE